MQTFIGTKIVNARPMNRQEYNDFRGWTVPAGENPADDGYLVEYTDGGKANTSEFAGYVSWSPKEQFDGAYTEVPSLGRSLAPHQLRVVAEKAELDDRLSKLNAFFCTSIFLGLDAIERGRLYAHASVMNDYSAVSMNDEQLDAAPSSTEPEQPAEEVGNVSAVAEESATEAVTTEGDAPNVDASPVADQSESDTASSAPPASSGADIAEGQLTGTEGAQGKQNASVDTLAADATGASNQSNASDSSMNGLQLSDSAPAGSSTDSTDGAEGDAGNSPGVSDGSGIESRIMALLHVARAAMVTLEQDVSRNVHAALDGIEALIGKRD
jgi:hypothetical protein